MRMIQGGNRPSLLLSRRAPNSPIQRAVCPSGGTPAAARRCLARRGRLGLCRSPDARSSSPRCRPASSRSRPIRPLQPRSQLLAASWRCLRPTSCRIAFVSPNREPRTLPGPSQNDPDHTYSLLIDAWLRGKPPAYLDILYPRGLQWVNWTPSSPTSVLVGPHPFRLLRRHVAKGVSDVTGVYRDYRPQTRYHRLGLSPSRFPDPVLDRLNLFPLSLWYKRQKPPRIVHQNFMKRVLAHAGLAQLGTEHGNRLRVSSAAAARELLCARKIRREQ